MLLKFFKKIGCLNKACASHTYPRGWHPLLHAHAPDTLWPVVSGARAASMARCRQGQQRAAGATPYAMDQHAREQTLNAVAQRPAAAGAGRAEDVDGARGSRCSLARAPAALI